jgi:hypothetical protein
VERVQERGLSRGWQGDSLYRMPAFHVEHAAPLRSLEYRRFDAPSIAAEERRAKSASSANSSLTTGLCTA